MSDKIMEAGFDHPCRQTCSGWQQGKERGEFDSKKEIERLKLEVKTYRDALEIIEHGIFDTMSSPLGTVINWVRDKVQGALKQYPKAKNEKPKV